MFDNFLFDSITSQQTSNEDIFFQLFFLYLTPQKLTRFNDDAFI